MHTRALQAGLKTVVLILALTWAGASSLHAESWKVAATYDLSSIPLSGFLETHTGQAGVNDHNITLGALAAICGTARRTTVRASTG